MSQVIIFKNTDGRVAVFHPSPERLSAVGAHALAQKYVPTGKPYKIIDAADLPSRDKRALWDVDSALLTDGVGAASNTFGA